MATGILLVRTASSVKARRSSPTYTDMIVAALKTFSGRTGCSRQGLVKKIMEDNDVGNDTRHVSLCFKKALKKGLENGRIKTLRETGKGAGKFKLNREHEDNVVKKVKKVVAKDDQKKVAKKRDGKSSKVSQTSTSKKIKPTAGKKAVKTVPATKKSSKAPKKIVKKMVKEVKKVKKPAAAKASKSSK